MKIAIQGEKGCFHEMAARQYFQSEEVEIVPCSTFDMTLNSVKEGGQTLPMMAIENARSGSILYNYSLIRESGLKIVGEHNLRVVQNLMALPGQTMKDIRQIRSHPIALSQCMTFLNQYPEITLVETDDTASSARIIAEGRLKKIAAIASRSAAEIYGLENHSRRNRDFQENYTKFLVIGGEGMITLRQQGFNMLCNRHKPAHWHRCLSNWLK
jgi:prephenate dehydratase